MSGGPLDFRRLAEQHPKLREMYLPQSDDPMDSIYGPNANVWAVIANGEEALKGSYFMTLPLTKEELTECESYPRVAIEGTPVYWQNTVVDEKSKADKSKSIPVEVKPGSYTPPTNEWIESDIRAVMHQAKSGYSKAETIYKGKTEDQVRAILKKKVLPHKDDRLQLSGGPIQGPHFHVTDGLNFWIRTPGTANKQQALFCNDPRKNLAAPGKYEYLHRFMIDNQPNAIVFGRLVKDASGKSEYFELLTDALWATWGAKMGIEAWFSKDEFYLGHTPD